MEKEASAEWVQRQERVSRIVEKLSSELDETMPAHPDFIEDVWLALQMIYGPGWAVGIMKRFQ